MAFLLRAISGGNNSFREKIKDAEDVNKTFQAELDNIRSCLDVEDDEIQSLMEMIFDSCFPESQRFLKYPTRDRLKFHKDTILRLLSALSFQDVPVANVLLRVVHKHGTEAVSDTLLTLLELVHPLLAMKDIPAKFCTNEDTSDDSVENQWHSFFRSSPGWAGSKAQSLHLNVLQSPSCISLSKSLSPGSLSFRLDSFNKMDSSVNFGTPPHEVPFKFPESKWEQVNAALQRTSSPSVPAEFKLPESEIFTNSSSRSTAMVSSTSSSFPTPPILKNNFKTFSTPTSRYCANASKLQLGQYSNGDRLVLPWLHNRTGDGSKEFCQGFLIPTTHYSQTRKLLPLEEDIEEGEGEEDEPGPSVFRDSNIKWKQQNGYACLKALHLQNAVTTEELTEFMASDSRNRVSIDLDQEQGSKLSNEHKEFEELNQVHLRSPATIAADLNNTSPANRDKDLESTVSSWGDLPAGAGAMDGFGSRGAAQAMHLGNFPSEENCYSSDSELEEESFSSDESSLDVEVSDNEGDDDLWDGPVYDEHCGAAECDLSSPHLQRSFSAPLLRSNAKNCIDRNKDFRTQSLPSQSGAKKDYTLLAVEDNETAYVKADQPSDQSVFDTLPEDLHFGAENRIMERDALAPHDINASNRFLGQEESTSVCAAGSHTTTTSGRTSGDSELKLSETCCEDLLCSEDLSLAGSEQQEAAIVNDQVITVSQNADKEGSAFSFSDQQEGDANNHALATSCGKDGNGAVQSLSPLQSEQQEEGSQGNSYPVPHSALQIATNSIFEYNTCNAAMTLENEEAQAKGNEASHGSHRMKLSDIPVVQEGASVNSGSQGEEETEMPIIAADQSLHSATTLEAVGANPLTPDWEATSKDSSAGLNLEEKSHQRTSNDKLTAASQNCPDKLAASRDAELVNTGTTAAVSLDNSSEKQLKSTIAILEPDTTDQVLVPTTACKVLAQFTPDLQRNEEEEEAQAHMQQLSEESHHPSQTFYAHTNCNQGNLPELQITQAGNPQACNLLELPQDHAGGSAAANAAFGNKIKALNPILLTGNNSHRRTDSIASLHSFPIPMGRTKASHSPKGAPERWTFLCCFSAPSTS
ncbi:unnamed protein product [Sphagnum troendelagicum]|uniref:Uncharacterized protein n=1 Tax=Sphagnum troendelagicum TaxID=128251 RepID=A0ABP0UTV5_9BRYO